MSGFCKSYFTDSIHVTNLYFFFFFGLVKDGTFELGIENHLLTMNSL